MRRFLATLAVSASLAMVQAGPALSQQDILGEEDDADAQEELSVGGCESFAWDVSHELAVLSKPALPLVAGANPKTAPHLDLDQRYEVKLVPQEAVRFAVKPGKPGPGLGPGAQGGLVSFHTPKAGRYRVSITTGHWIDLVDGGNLIVSRDFQGQRDCEKVHKIVQFELSGNKDFILQLSNAADITVGIAITQVKAP